MNIKISVRQSGVSRYTQPRVSDACDVCRSHNNNTVGAIKRYFETKFSWTNSLNVIE